MDKNKELFLVLSELFNNLDFSLDQDWVTAALDLTSNVFIFIPTDKAAVFWGCRVMDYDGDIQRAFSGQN